MFPELWQASVGLIGGLALFLYGIEKLSGALQSVAGNGLNSLFAKLTSNRFVGVTTGIIVTGIVQSSSLTTVLVVGFVSAGLMTLQQSIGVIMGANIGTTLTIHLAAFKITHSAWLLIGLGFACTAFSRKDFAKHLGALLIGLGFLFLALDQMTTATTPLREFTVFSDIITGIERPLIGVLVGAVFTALIQSSSATSGLVIALAAQGAITLPAALAVMLGSNLGSCATAVLAGWGRPAEARQAAFIHVLFNAFGVTLWIGLLPQLAWMVHALTNDLPRQIATAHTIFNVANTVLLIWFVRPMARIAQWCIPQTAATPPVDTHPHFLDRTLLGTPSLALDRARLELAHMGELVVTMLERAPKVILTGSSTELRRTADMVRRVETLYVAILDYARNLARSELSQAETRKLESIISAANYLESTADIIATNWVSQGMRRIEHKLHISPATQLRLTELLAVARNSLADGLKAMLENDNLLAKEVIDRKESFNVLMENAYRHIRKRLVSTEPNRLPAFQVEVDLVHLMQRIFYFARRTARLALQSPEELRPESESPTTATDSTQPLSEQPSTAAPP